MTFKVGFKEDSLYGKNEKGAILKALPENRGCKNDLFSQKEFQIEVVLNTFVTCTGMIETFTKK